MNRKTIIGVPCRNCEKTIGFILECLLPALEKNTSISIVVMDNKSSDRTVEMAEVFVAKNKNVRDRIKIVANKRNLGYGGTQKCLLSMARRMKAEYFMNVHGDGQGDPTDIFRRFDAAVRKRPDATLFLASRFLNRSKIDDYDRERVWGNKLFNLITSWATGVELTDYGTGIMCVHVGRTKDLNLNCLPPNLLFHPVLNLMVADAYPERIHEVPLRWGRAESTSVNLISYGLSYLLFLAKYVFFKKIKKDTTPVALRRASFD